eukprot:Gb_30141 [translate_table: standard]
MVSVLLHSLPRSFCNLSKNFSEFTPSKHVRSLVVSDGGVTLIFSCKRSGLHCVSLRGGVTELTSSHNIAFSKCKLLCGVRGRGGGRGICYCKNEKNREENSTEKGLEKLDWPILDRWDVPWDWKTTLFTMMASGFSFLLTGLAESTVISYFGIRQKHLMSLDERATVLFVDQFLITAVGLAVIYAVVSRYKPLPDDLFCYRWQEPFSLRNGWLLWGGVGLITASIGVAFAGAAITALNGEPPQRETDALLLLLPLIGASKISTACLIGVTGILAPLFEETIFRGFLMTSLTKWLPTPVAVLLSASAFSVAHLTPGEFPQLFVLGAVLGFSYAQTRNLVTPITIHAFWNSGVIVLLTFLRLQGYDIQEFLQ